jgi:polyisoprenoid-binding protein YceI
MMTHRLLIALLLNCSACAASAQESEAAAPPPPPVSAKAALLPAGHYKIDPKHSSVVAVVRHLGVSDYLVRFDKFDADFTYDPARPEATKLQASVDAASFDVGADYSKNFANTFVGADKFPKVTFVATSMTPNPDGRTGTMTGDLSFNGATRSVTFNVTFIASGHGLPFGTIAGFNAEATIKRFDFNSHAWSHYVSNDVQLQIRAAFDKK